MSEVTLKHDSGEIPLKEVPATVGSSGLDISGLLKETSHVALDHGFMNTASCSSAITYIDGDQGILRYRGYPIEQLAGQSTFLETSYLLIYGTLPTPAQLTEFENNVSKHTMVHEELRRFFDGFLVGLMDQLQGLVHRRLIGHGQPFGRRSEWRYARLHSGRRRARLPLWLVERRGRCAVEIVRGRVEQVLQRRRPRLQCQARRHAGSRQET